MKPEGKSELFQMLGNALRPHGSTPSIDYPGPKVYGVLSPDDKDDPEDYDTWTTAELIGILEPDEAEDAFCCNFDPDGPFRYTGDFEGWWEALRMMDEAEVRKVVLDIIKNR